MAITDEQRAMLQLLLEGGQGYDDIGSLLGIAPDEVRRRARAALQEIGGADPDAQVGLSDFLLGQADPIGRADAVRHLQSDPEANALAERLVQHLKLLAPKAQLPEIPPVRGGRRAAAPPPPAAPPAAAAPAPPTAPAADRGPGLASRVSGRLSALAQRGNRRTQLAVALAAGLVAVVAIVLATSSSGSGGGSKGDCSSVDTSKAQQAGIPTIKLQPVGAAASEDCPPSGQVTLGPVPQQTQQNQQNQQPQFALTVNAVNVKPTTSGDVYLLWLYKSDTQAFPLGQQTVDSSGNLTGGVPLAGQQVLALSAFDSVRLSRVTTAEVQQVQQAAQQQGKQATGIVPFAGEPVLEGATSELGLQQILQQAQSQAQAQGGGTGTTQSPGTTGK